VSLFFDEKTTVVRSKKLSVADGKHRKRRVHSLSIVNTIVVRKDIMRKKTNCVIKFMGLNFFLFLYFKKVKIFYFKLFFIFVDIKNILKILFKIF
jgi:hypothetical protein